MDGGYPDFIKITWHEGDKKMATFQVKKDMESLQIMGKWKGKNYLLSRNLKTNSVKYLQEDALQALLILEQGLPESSAEYLFYLKKEINLEDKYFLHTLSVVEILALSIYKFYEVENR
jgi:hypothetical protein